MRIQNVKITSTFLGVEDHGIMTFMIHVQGESFGIGVGGYGLDWSPRDKGVQVSSGGWGFGAIRKILETLEVRSWEHLKGTYCRVEFGKELGKAVAIGHITDDKWFRIAEYMSQSPTD